MIVLNICYIYMCVLILFVLYTVPISEIASSHAFSRHSFSDDNKLYKSGPLNQLPSIIQSTQSCIQDKKSWMPTRKLQRKNDKTEVIFLLPGSISMEFSPLLSSSFLIDFRFQYITEKFPPGSMRLMQIIKPCLAYLKKNG